MLLSLPLILPVRPPRLRLRPIVLLLVVQALVRIVWQNTTNSADQLKRAWKTPTKWKPIPVALGALVLLAVQFRHTLLGIDEPEVTSQGKDGAVIKPSIDGPWQVSRHNPPPPSIPQSGASKPAPTPPIGRPRLPAFSGHVAWSCDTRVVASARPRGRNAYQL
jgi:hypothetical protein